MATVRGVAGLAATSPGPGPGPPGVAGGLRRPPARQTVEFSLKGPVHVTLDEAPAGPPGCSVVDLLFSSPSQVSELVFHNYYTAWLTVLVRMLVAAPAPGPGPAPAPGLAPGPAPVTVPEHSSQGQAQLQADQGQSAVPWTELVAMRLVLRQPSPSWHTFHVEEIHVFAEPPRRAVWGRRHGQPSPAPASTNNPAAAAGAGAAAVAPTVTTVDQNAYDSVLMLLRQQTQAALRASFGPGPSPGTLGSVAPGARMPTLTPAPARAAAYELNSLPPV
ncbi:Nicolin-1 [Frankliniella fusca]|uniref:Nicolin-1 n=1 Tax=Frankliniella fusca TaxID=407009 RepID=A0AAE1LUR6_9NEOP|nr:Nicolin-1 [Frankliniella fusca]